MVARYEIQVDRSELNGPDRRWGVLDNRTHMYARLADGRRCFGLTSDDALDALNELRGGQLMERWLNS